MDRRFLELIEVNPIIAAVKDDMGLEACCSSSDIKIVFVLYGDICTVAQIVERIKDADKVAIVHVDLINGLSGKEINVDFIKQNTSADGIISTKPALIKRAKELKLFTVLRIFLLDSLAYETIQKQIGVSHPDVIEILPGLMPEMITRVRQMVRMPVIAGGLISRKEDVMSALAAGAISISSTNQQVWRM